MSGSKSKATWTPEYLEIFVDLCLKETLKGNRPGTHLTREGWMNVMKAFHRQTGARYDRKQLKNHWDGTKEQWRVWRNLISTSHMKWDPITYTFGASKEEWIRYIKASPKAAQFRRKKLPLVDKLETIFDGTIITMNGRMLLSTKTAHSDQSGTEGQGTTISETETVDSWETDESRSYTSGQHTRTGEDGMAEQGLCLTMQRERARWTSENHKIFIDLCVEQTLKGNKPGTHFTREGWRNIAESFNRITGSRFDRMQFKNRWDGTKMQWKIWCKLTGDSMMKWDPNTKMFGATEDDWADFLQENPGAAQFRCTEIPLIDELDVIFSGSGESKQIVTPRQRRRLNDHSVTSILRAVVPETAKSDRKNKNSCKAVESRSVAMAQRSTAISQTLTEPCKLNYSIGECIECLDEMEDVEQGSDFYLFALDTFLKREYREIFLQLKKPRVRVAWLLRLQSLGTDID